jgi:hypothetical protein
MITLLVSDGVPGLQACAYFSASCFLKSQGLLSVFGSMVAVAFQIAFRAKIHANDVFLFFKNHF